MHHIWEEDQYASNAPTMKTYNNYHQLSAYLQQVLHVQLVLYDAARVGLLREDGSVVVDVAHVHGEAGAVGQHGVARVPARDAHAVGGRHLVCLSYTSPSPRDMYKSRMPSSA